MSCYRTVGGLLWHPDPPWAPPGRDMQQSKFCAQYLRFLKVTQALWRKHRYPNRGWTAWRAQVRSVNGKLWLLGEYRKSDDAMAALSNFWRLSTGIIHSDGRQHWRTR